ncbi:MAG: fumarylacetoacetate hydrolase family protein [Planctomycetes bacterium]|nr:fumarylacetoacetate hydrolase family protein [Planctomycetota bacterium]
MLAAGLFTREHLAPVLAFIEEHNLARDLRLAGEIEFLPPVARPSKVLAMAKNYALHAREMDAEPPEEPLFFAKAPSAITAHQKEVVLPRWLNSAVHYEAELALVIGKRAKYVTPDAAMACVAGYTIANDVTARGMQKADKEAGHPWLRSKSFDTFCPLGPYLVPRDFIRDPHALSVACAVNGAERQSGNTRDMLFRIPDVVVAMSRCMTLEPGDVILTGTPEGVGPLAAGDLLETTVGSLGTLRNRVVAEK